MPFGKTAENIASLGLLVGVRAHGLLLGRGKEAMLAFVRVRWRVTPTRNSRATVTRAVKRRVRGFPVVPERPQPVRDLDWPAERARALADGAVELWEELLAGLRDRPVTRPW